MNAYYIIKQYTTCKLSRNLTGDAMVAIFIMQGLFLAKLQEIAVIFLSQSTANSPIR